MNADWLERYRPSMFDALPMPKHALLESAAWFDVPDNPPPHPFNAVAECLGLTLATITTGASREQLAQVYVSGARRFGKSRVFEAWLEAAAYTDPVTVAGVGKPTGLLVVTPTATTKIRRGDLWFAPPVTYEHIED